MLHWQDIMQSWDDQQTEYVPWREQRFTAMLDVLDILFEGAFTVLDLACGPASISQRVLRRFPAARCIAADLDPVLMEIGKQVLAGEPRLTWLDVDLNQPTWTVNGSEPLDWLKTQAVDAVLTTTALHWLPPASLVRVYRQLGELLPPGGVVLNGDHMMFLPYMTTFRRVSETVKAWQREQMHETPEQSRYAAWWHDLRADLMQADAETYGALFAERERRFATRRRDFSEPIRAMHQAALCDAGFVEVGSIWQHFDNCVLLAVRGPDQAPIKN